MTAFSFSIEPYGENGWIATLSKGDMVGRALAANAAADTLRERPGVTDAVAGVESIVLRFRPSEVAAEAAKTMLSDALQNFAFRCCIMRMNTDTWQPRTDPPDSGPWC